ncbi:hypothetical protein Q5752_006955 [Cryptotrichosporon argae]
MKGPEAPAFLPYSAGGKKGMTIFAAGDLISIFLLGIIASSVLRYYVSYPRDSRFTKTFVALITLFTFADTAFNTSRLIRAIGPGAGNMSYLIRIRGIPEAWLAPLFAMLTQNLTEGFMIIRVVRFARALRSSYGPRFALGVHALTALLALGFMLDIAVGLGPALWMSQFASVEPLYADAGALSPTFHFLWNAQIGTFMVMDLIITVSLTTELFLANRGFASSDSALGNLRTLCMRNSALVLVLQALEIILTYVDHAAWYFFVSIFIGKVRVLACLSIIVLPRRAHASAAARAEDRLRALRDGLARDPEIAHALPVADPYPGSQYASPLEEKDGPFPFPFASVPASASARSHEREQERAHEQTGDLRASASTGHSAGSRAPLLHSPQASYAPHVPATPTFGAPPAAEAAHPSVPPAPLGQRRKSSAEHSVSLAEMLASSPF